MLILIGLYCTKSTSIKKKKTRKKLINLTPVFLVLSGPPGTPKVENASKTCINLTWTPPEDDKGVPIIGYLLEKRKKDTTEWISLNDVSEPIEGR